MKFRYIMLICAISALILAVPVSAIDTIINQGATVYVGEEGLDISNALTIDGIQRHNIGHWEAGASIRDTAPSETMYFSDGKNFEVTQTMSLGSWYSFNETGSPVQAFIVADPSIKLIIESDEIDVSNKNVTKDAVIKFKIDSNIFLDRRIGVDPTTDGFMDIKIISPAGATYVNLIGTNGSTTNTQNIFVNGRPYTWIGDWNLGAMNSNEQKIYPAGTYTAIVECTLNKMNLNYNVAGKTSSVPKTITIGYSSVVLTIDKESVMRNKPFSVTIIGRQNTYYNLWIKDINKMNTVEDQPPTIGEGQEGVDVNNLTTRNYTPQNSAKTIGQQVPDVNGSYFAMVRTSIDGTRTVQFNTGPNTTSKKYTIRVEEKIDNQYKYDEVTIEVGKGSITIVTDGYQNYYIGDVIKLSGTNSESYETFLFITGPNLPSNGAQIESSDPRGNAVVNGDRDTFHIESVDSGDWSWELPTTNLALDAGTYTIYAVSTPNDRLHFENTNYATTSITLKKPYVSASISQSTVARGDELSIRGIAEGTPSSGVQIWIMGKNFMFNDVASTDSGSTFDYTIDRSDTSNLANGQYFVVIQHPMQNGQFDIIERDNYIVNLQMNQNGNVSGTEIFLIKGPGSLQGTDAAEALIEALDNQNIDDTYTKLQFLVEQPFINLDPIGDRSIGDKFTITGKTNLAVEDNVQIEIYSSSFQPTSKLTSGEFSGTTGTVKVVSNDDNNGYNRIEFQVDASTFNEDEYIVIARGVEMDASTSTLFNVRGQSLVNETTVTPTLVPMSTAMQTPIPTTIVPTPTPTPASPGFGAIFALIGIIIVGFIIVKRE